MHIDYLGQCPAHGKHLPNTNFCSSHGNSRKRNGGGGSTIVGGARKTEGPASQVKIGNRLASRES